jgi:DNA-binding MarR family transcriptional regulator
LSRAAFRNLALEVQDELRLLSTEIDGLDDRAARHLGVNRTDLRCLDVLTGSGPQRPSDLARALRLTTGGLSIALERLETAGYIRRRQHKDDRRSVLVEATDKAHRLDDEVFGPIEERMRRVLDRYDAEELTAVLRFLRDTREAIST